MKLNQKFGTDERERSEEKTDIWTDENQKTEIAVLLSCHEINQRAHSVIAYVTLPYNTTHLYD